jgi:hypothetical protein
MKLLSRQPSLWFVALLGLAFVLIGIRLATVAAGALPHGDSLTLQYIHLFGVRDAFLGALVLLLLFCGEQRALFLFLVSATLLPLADILVLAGTMGWGSAARANLPYEIPLILAAVLLGRKPTPAIG